MTTFALAHGAFHGAWCWEQLTPLLEAAGHDVVTMELPIDDPSASFDDHADVICAALRGRDDVILIGHSFAGNAIPLAAARFPVQHLVYLCAAVPEPGRSMTDQLGDDDCLLNPQVYAGFGVPDEQGRVNWADLQLARELFYADCDDWVADAAADRLRSQAGYSATLPFALTEFPFVPTTSIVCDDDQVIVPNWSRRMARELLYANLVELPGSHSPFYSRPAVLADVLLGLAG
jgi:pimeloyl-ACP methyl ester carboxylesterase